MVRQIGDATAAHPKKASGRGLVARQVHDVGKNRNTAAALLAFDA